ncbi:MAG: hypothetical protein DMD64_15575 [Gemmatimonadetes bacterium]|nr:MAG: hypothetical protein DMD64_15575 [Gemmatimonadota bacterium]PYU98502.1 MAG: hypothetical protein DMG10_28045 [Acidobacteriota bacterium]
MRRRRRITLAAVRRLALALPEAVERSHFDVPDFRVRNKIFAALPDGDRAVVVKTDPANAEALVSWDGIAFWNEWRGRWLGVRLDRVSLPVLRDLLSDAWRLVAPKKLTAVLRESGPRAPPNKRLKLAARVD